MGSNADDKILEYIKNHQGENITGLILSKHLYYGDKYIYLRLQHLENQGKIERIKTIIIPGGLTMDNKEVWKEALDIDVMDFNEYQLLALRTANKENKDLILNGALGLSGESGEVADVVKKHLFQGHELNKDKIVDELGDVLWYIAIMAKGLGVNMEDIATHNVAKLKKRYPEGFDKEKSINREE